MRYFCAAQYDPSNPVASHFTQMVWKSTTQLGCAVQSCNGIFDSSYGVRSELFSIPSLWDHANVEGPSLHNTMYVNTTPRVMSTGNMRESFTHYIPFAFLLSLSTAKTFRFKCRSDIALKRWIVTLVVFSSFFREETAFLSLSRYIWMY